MNAQTNATSVSYALSARLRRRIGRARLVLPLVLLLVLTVFAREAGGQYPPQVSTLPADYITFDSARINCTLSPNGPTTAWFEWGTTTGYGNYLGPYYSSAKYPVDLHGYPGGLNSGRTYHFRAVATNSYGKAYGGDQEFTTLALPVVTTLPATDITLGGATLNGTVNPSGIPTIAAWEYGTNTSYGNYTAWADVGSGHGEVPIPPLYLTVPIPGTTIHFCAIAHTDFYGDFYGGDLSFTTPVLPPLIINTGSGCWDAASSTLSYAGGADGVHLFVLLQSADPAASLSGWARVATKSSNPGSFSIPPVGTAAPHYYRIKIE